MSETTPRRPVTNAATTGKRARAPKTSKSSVPTALIEEINAWAVANGQLQDPYIRELTRSLTTGEDLIAIAEFNPLDTLPRPTLKTGARSVSLSNTLSIIRNVLVFVPVALTWIAISKSTTAFAWYTEANKSSVVNFLEFWQNGYGVLSKSWTIGEVAFLDFMIIMSVIGLTLITAFMNKSRMVKQKEFATKAGVERLELAIAINKFLVAARTPTASSINQTTAAAVTSLNAAVRNLGAASKDALTKIREIPSNKQVLAELKKMNQK
jgi:hypothetical protein